MPEISIVMPAYNGEETILASIQSVQQQTFSDFELIAIDDGGNDRTRDIVEAIDDPRIKIFSYKNGGLPVARNRGISRATGAFVAFLDQDDLWTPDKLEQQLAALKQHPDAGVAYSWTAFMEEQGQYFHKETPIYFEGNVYTDLLLRNFVASGSNPLVRRQALESVQGYDPNLKFCADWDFYLRLAARWPYVVVPKYQIFYRQSSGSLSSKIEALEQESLAMLENSFKTAPDATQQLKSFCLAQIYQYSAQLYLTRVQTMDGVRLAREKLKMATQLAPKIWLDRKTLSLVAKLILSRALSPQVATRLLQRLSKLRATAMNPPENGQVSAQFPQ